MADIIIGTVQFGLDYGINNSAGKPSQEAVFEILKEAQRLGITTLDTADGYGTATELIGAFHQQATAPFRINTKFTYHSNRPVKEMLYASIRALNVPSVDSYFYHSFSEYQSHSEDVAQLEELKAEGSIKQIGVSVYTNQELQMVIDDPHVDVIQLPFNLLDNDHQRGALLRDAKEKGKRVQVRSVFLQGLFFKPLENLPGFLLALQPYLRQIQTIATESNSSIEELCMQYVEAQPYIDDMLIGVDSKEQLLRNVNASKKTISAATIKKINGIHVADVNLLYPYNWNK